MTENGMVIAASPSKLTLISASKKQIVSSLPISDYPVYSKWACFATSGDGKYVRYVTRNGIYLNSISNEVISQVYTDTRVYRSVQFSIADPGKLYLTFYNSTDLEIRNASDFSLVKTVSLPYSGLVMRNVDPVSGIILMTDYSNVYFVDPASSRFLGKLACSLLRPYLLNNVLYGENGRYFDMSKLIKK